MVQGISDQITMVACTIASALLVVAVGLTVRARRIAKLERQTVPVKVATR